MIEIARIPVDWTSPLRDSLSRYLSEEVSLLRPVDPDCAIERQLWRACELCSYAENRQGGDPPDPRGLSEATMAAWSERWLTDMEEISDPADLSWTKAYWLEQDGKRIGTVALTAEEWGRQQSILDLSSLYIFPEYRRQGYGRRLLTTLTAACQALGLSGQRLDTSWLWQTAVWFYLRQGLWVYHWKRDLRLIRWLDDPGYRVTDGQDRLQFYLTETTAPLLSAMRDGDRLIWIEETAFADLVTQDIELSNRAITTFSLWLAMSGWPLIRDHDAWMTYRYLDAGEPEALAYKITIYEAYARAHGFSVRTPRIPGLVYPDWERFVSQ